ncbi:hypothetical protein [Pedobacter gandavensis]|uniref:Ppx/GppA phosphatase domain-containing protein n=1 Tax=Pedobacter gandavensis TaxID=2679963 RepID=A0ABR6EQT1_9SPHI|nr:hypothetical protein [Pedobacter gandavensis]MBB2147596.1 hypothetical protein [Pedobacter gandavensis]
MKPLNIFDAGNPNTGWRSVDKLSDRAIGDFMDKSAKTSNALNAVPSPFARMHIFETAFKLIVKDAIDGQNNASDVYKGLISNCLDILELVFNLNFHKSQGDNISIVNWTVNDLDQFKAGSEGQKTFQKTIDMYLRTDLPSLDGTISIIKYKDMVLGGTSPFSLLFSAPSFDRNTEGAFRDPYLDQQFDLINPNTETQYFKKTIPFSKRKLEFQLYILKIFNDHPILKEKMKVFYDYFRQEGIEKIGTNYTLKLADVRSDNGGYLSVFGVNIQGNVDESSLDIFNDHIVKVGYRLNGQSFQIPTYLNDVPSRDFDYLLPIKESFLNHIDLNKIGELFQYEIIGANLKVSYTASSLIKPKHKIYRLPDGPDVKLEGKIIDISSDLRYKLTLGIFPFLQVIDQEQQLDPRYNDYYKVLLAVYDTNSHLKNTNDFSLDFFKKEGGMVNQITSETTLFNSKRFNRRSFEAGDPIASIYYEVKNTTFDVIKLNLPGAFKFNGLSGLIIPKWRRKVLGSKSFNFSVDFGTTNTFIAYADKSIPESKPKHFEIGIDDVQMVMLHEVPKAGPGESITTTFKKGTNDLLVVALFNQEFVPPVLLPKEEKSPFRMPFRTAIFQQQNIKNFNLFDDLNIHFAYQKLPSDENSKNYQETITNLKWDITNKTDLGSKRRIQNFIKELCLLIKYKTLLNNGDPATVNVTWFIPQSLSYGAIKDYAEIWDAEVSGSLQSLVAPRKVYESEAPYYFLKKNAAIDNPRSVLSIDIGGGSTDAMLFVNDIPRIGTSFNFAGNVLWSNGYDQFSNDSRANGFYQKMHEAMEAKMRQNQALSPHLSDLQHKSTDEIINFWISNSEDLPVFDLLKAADFRVVYLVHYCAVVFHLMQFIKMNNQPAPTCIIFSGNGSKYIDLLGDTSILSKISAFITEKVFGSSEGDQQVILPKENRKEATCFGGIYKEHSSDFVSKTHIGTQLNHHEGSKIKTYTDVENNLNSIKQSINHNITDLFEIIKALDERLSFKSMLSIDYNISSIKNMILSQLDSFFDKGYNIRKGKVAFEEDVTDSLFFYPFTGIIFELAKVSNDTLEKFIPKHVRYMSAPHSENVFHQDKIHPEITIDSIFRLMIPENNPNEAVYEIIDDQEIYRRGWMSYDTMLEPVCICDAFPTSTSNYLLKQTNTGKLRKDGDTWVVTERLRIEFINN